MPPSPALISRPPSQARLSRDLTHGSRVFVWPVRLQLWGPKCCEAYPRSIPRNMLPKHTPRQTSRRAHGFFAKTHISAKPLSCSLLVFQLLEASFANVLACGVRHQLCGLFPPGWYVTSCLAKYLQIEGLRHPCVLPALLQFTFHATRLSTSFMAFSTRKPETQSRSVTSEVLHSLHVISHDLTSRSPTQPRGNMPRTSTRRP